MTLHALLRATEAVGAELTLEIPGRDPVRLRADPERAVVRFANEAAAAVLERGDHLAMAEAFLARIRCAPPIASLRSSKVFATSSARLNRPACTSASACLASASFRCWGMEAKRNAAPKARTAF